MKSKQLKFFDVEKEKPRRHYFIIPLDTFILSLALIVLLIIISFGLGVERGRKSVIPYYNSGKDTEKVLMLHKSQLVSSEIEKDKKGEKAKNTSTKKYVIQVATYKNENIAKREKKLLEKKGLPTIISQKGNYVVIYVGEYPTRKEAESKLKSLRSRYRDCFVRRL
jgi:septal ring-binding cell division protein DamX